MTIYIIYNLIALLGGAIEGFFDGKRAKKGKKVEHNISFALRLIGTATAVYLLNVTWLVYPMLLLLYSVGVDLSFNLSRGKELGYIGKTAKFDKLIRKTPIGSDGILYQMSKLIVAGAIFIIIGI